MPDKQLSWEQVRNVLIKRRKAGQAPHWCMGWVSARVAQEGDSLVYEAYQRTVLDYFGAHAPGNEDAIKTRTWHRLIGFVDGLHNGSLPEPTPRGRAAPAGGALSADAIVAEGHASTEQLDDDDKTLVMDL